MILRIKVKPNSKVHAILKAVDGSIQIKIKAPLIEGKANAYLVGYLALVLNLSKSKIQLLKGGTTAFKTLQIHAEEEYVTQKILSAI